MNSLDDTDVHLFDSRVFAFMIENWKNRSLESILFIDENGKRCTEKWVDIINYEGFYKGSNLGRVKSLERKVRNSQGFILKKETILKQCLNVRGYPYVILCVDQVRWHCAIHRMVGIHFIPNPENKPEVNHKADENRIVRKTDNKYFMLEWNTGLENTRHAFEYGLMSCRKGERANSAKITEKQVLAIRRLHRINPRFNRTKIAKKLGVTINQISLIVHGKSWKHLL